MLFFLAPNENYDYQKYYDLGLLRQKYYVTEIWIYCHEDNGQRKIVAYSAELLFGRDKLHIVASQVVRKRHLYKIK